MKDHASELLVAHSEAQDSLRSLRHNLRDTLVKWAAVGRILDLARLSPAEIEAIDPDIERWRLAYHSAKRLVASNPEQIEFSSLKLLSDHSADSSPLAAPPRRPVVEAVRLAENLLKNVDKVDVSAMGDGEQFTLRATLDRVIAGLSVIRGRLHE